jgi:hypothetical protein
LWLSDAVFTALEWLAREGRRPFVLAAGYAAGALVMAVIVRGCFHHASTLNVPLWFVALAAWFGARAWLAARLQGTGAASGR